MFALLFTVIIGLGIAFFATQNTNPVILQLTDYRLSMPLYVVMIGSLLLGLFISWLISLANAISSFFTMKGRDSIIQQERKTILDLRQKVHMLELENARLKGEKGEVVETLEHEQKEHHPNFFERFMHRPRFA